MTTLLLLVLYAVTVAGVAFAAARLGRPLVSPALPRGEGRGEGNLFVRGLPLLFCALLPIVFLLPGFVSDRTPLPVDHIRSLPPWSALGPVVVRNPNLNDVALQFAPWQRAVRDSWRDGEFPHRDRWNGCGTPLAANGSSSAFSPLVLLGLLLPLAQSFTLQGALKLFLALTGTWLWLTELKVSRDAALIGSVAFAFSFSMTPWLYFPQTAVLCLWPWAFFAVELLRDRAASRRALVLLAVVLALWAASGHIESVASGAALLLLCVAVRRLAGDLPDAGRILVRIAGAGMLAMALTAFVLIPHALAIFSSQRFVLARQPFWQGVFSWVPHGPAWPAGLATIFFPRSLGDSLESPTIPGRVGSFPEMGLGYLGIVGWALVLLLLWPGSTRRRTEVGFAVPLAIGLAVAIGLWPFVEIFGHVPGLKMMFPLRFLSWIPICGAALAAFGLDSWGRSSPSPLRGEGRGEGGSSPSPLRGEGRGEGGSRPLLVALALAAFAVLAFLRFRERHAAAGGFASQRDALILALATLGVFALLGLTRRRAVLYAVLLGSAELVHQGSRLYRFGKPEDLAPPTPLLQFLARQPGTFRVVGDGAALFPNSNVFARLEDVRTHDPIERREYVAFLDAAAGYPPAEYFKSLQDLDAPALDYLNVGYLVSAPGREPPGPRWRPVYSGADGTVFQNRSALPRLFAPARVEPAASAAASSSPRRTDWGERALVLPSEWRGHTGPAAGANGRAAISRYRETANTVRFHASVAAGGPALVATSIVDDGGWTARGRGDGVALGRVNGPFLALLIPPGERDVVLRYTAPGFRLGATISLVALLAFAVALAAGRRVHA